MLDTGRAALALQVTQHILASNKRQDDQPNQRQGNVSSQIAFSPSTGMVAKRR